MKFKHLAQMFLSLCLAVQLNFAEANNNYDEEITLPVGTNFDLEMEEITRYEYDGNYVKAQTVNGKEQFILQKTGDTIINVIMEENGQKTEMRVLVHIVTEQQFNGTEPTKQAPKATAPASTTQNKPATTTLAKATTPATTTQTKPATTAPAATTQANPAATAPAATTQANPAATAPAKATTPATTTQTKPATTAPAKTEAPATAVTQPAKVTAPATPAASASKIYGTPVSRPANATPANTIEAAKLKAQNLSFDVLDLVNAERAKAGLAPLTMTKDLMDVALLRSKEIPKRFSHTRPDNTRYFTAMTMQGSVREENIAAGQTTATAVVKAWMAAPNSKEIILNPAFRELGVGYFETIGANYACYWVQIFRG